MANKKKLLPNEMVLSKVPGFVFIYYYSVTEHHPESGTIPIRNKYMNEPHTHWVMFSNRLTAQ